MRSGSIEFDMDMDRGVPVPTFSPETGHTGRGYVMMNRHNSGALACKVNTLFVAYQLFTLVEQPLLR